MNLGLNIPLAILGIAVSNSFPCCCEYIPAGSSIGLSVGVNAFFNAILPATAAPVPTAPAIANAFFLSYVVRSSASLNGTNAFSSSVVRLGIGMPISLRSTSRRNLALSISSCNRKAVSLFSLIC